MYEKSFFNLLPRALAVKAWMKYLPSLFVLRQEETDSDGNRSCWYWCVLKKSHTQTEPRIRPLTFWFVFRRPLSDHLQRSVQWKYAACVQSKSRYILCKNKTLSAPKLLLQLLSSVTKPEWKTLQSVIIVWCDTAALLTNDAPSAFWLLRVLSEGFSFYMHSYLYPTVSTGTVTSFLKSNRYPLPSCSWVKVARRKRVGGGGVELEIYGPKGDWLVPSLALMYGWQSPPPSPSHLLTHTYTPKHHLATIQFSYTHIQTPLKAPRPFLTVPQSCCMLSCSRQTAVFSVLPLFFFFSRP